MVTRQNQDGAFRYISRTMKICKKPRNTGRLWNWVAATQTMIYEHFTGRITATRLLVSGTREPLWANVTFSILCTISVALNCDLAALAIGIPEFTPPLKLQKNNGLKCFRRAKFRFSQCNHQAQGVIKQMGFAGSGGASGPVEIGVHQLEEARTDLGLVRHSLTNHA
jgi:hypothetical protein